MNGNWRRRSVERRAAIDQVLGRMAGIAIARFEAIGFCTDDDFRRAGYPDDLIRAHGDRARHRAQHVMTRNRALKGVNDGSEPAARPASDRGA